MRIAGGATLEIQALRRRLVDFHASRQEEISIVSPNFPLLLLKVFRTFALVFKQILQGQKLIPGLDARLSQHL